MSLAVPSRIRRGGRRRNDFEAVEETLLGLGADAAQPLQATLGGRLLQIVQGADASLSPQLAGSARTQPGHLEKSYDIGRHVLAEALVVTQAPCVGQLGKLLVDGLAHSGSFGGRPRDMPG